MNDTKYIVFENEHIAPTMLVFGPTITHLAVAMWLPTGCKMVSAGFMSTGINKDGALEAFCYGRSVSLGLSSKPEQDNKLANKLLNPGDW